MIHTFGTVCRDAPLKLNWIQMNIFSNKTFCEERKKIKIQEKEQQNKNNWITAFTRIQKRKRIMVCW